MIPTTSPSPWRKSFFSWKTIVLLGIAFATVACACVFFFLRSREVIDRLVKDRLRNEAAIAALSFAGEELDAIRSTSEMQSTKFGELVWRLNDIRARSPQIRFAYIMRRTADPLTLEFVVDADALNTPEQLDSNGNGIVELSEGPGLPGEPYDISTIPALQDAAFQGPATDEDVTLDQWGYALSGYAPIRYADGRVAAVLGIDMTAENYAQIRQSIFSMQSLLLVLFGGMLVIFAVIAIIWRRRVQEMGHLDDERRWLLQLILHQVGTPLTIFRWGVESLREALPRLPDAARAEMEENILIMEDGVSRLGHESEVLLAADRIQEGNVRVADEQVSLQSVLDETKEGIAQQLAKRGQKLEVDVSADCTLHLDRRLLAGVLRELLDNAMVYSPKDGVITVRVLRHNRSVEVSVQDRGAGIPREDLSRMFERFSRGSNAGKFDPNGTGVGLYIAKGIIERFGGKISMYSTEGEGTTITFTLPLV